VIESNNNTQPFILGDWGTSNLRLNLCTQDGRILDQKQGAGIGEVRHEAPGHFFELTAPWRETYGAIDVLLCGMVGSNIGWLEVPYVECPTNIGVIAQQVSHFSAHNQQIHIIPGLKAQNPLGAPDVIRGEETQIIGAIEADPLLKTGPQLLCLPGTHTKWVFVQDGLIKTFLTALSGELFALFRKYSVLVDWHEELDPEGNEAFVKGLLRAKELSPTALLHVIFEVRSRQLVKELTPPGAVSYLSGLIIGRDVAGALDLFETSTKLQHVTLIGNKILSTLYQAAFAQHDVSTNIISGEQASHKGLQAIYAHLKNARI